MNYSLHSLGADLTVAANVAAPAAAAPTESVGGKAAAAPTKRTFKVHAFVLRRSSGFFRDLPEGHTCDLDQDASIFELLLPYIYYRQLDNIADLSSSELRDIFLLADFEVGINLCFITQHELIDDFCGKFLEHGGRHLQLLCKTSGKIAQKMTNL